MTHYDPSNDRAVSGALSGDLFLESSVKMSPRGFPLAFLSLSHTRSYQSNKDEQTQNKETYMEAER